MHLEKIENSGAYSIKAQLESTFKQFKSKRKRYRITYAISDESLQYMKRFKNSLFINIRKSLSKSEKDALKNSELQFPLTGKWNYFLSLDHDTFDEFDAVEFSDFILSTTLILVDIDLKESELGVSPSIFVFQDNKKTLCNANYSIKLLEQRENGLEL